MSLGDVKKLSAKDIEKYYNRYQIILGNKVTNTLVDTAIEAAVGVLSYVVPIDNNNELCKDLQNNEMLKQELNNIAGYIVLKGGRMVALSSCLVQLAKHVKISNSGDDWLAPPIIRSNLEEEIQSLVEIKQAVDENLEHS